MDKNKEQEIRVEARNWCGAIETDRGCSENQVESLAIHFYQKGVEEGTSIVKIHNLIKKPVKDRTNEEHHILIRHCGGVRDYLLTMGNLKMLKYKKRTNTEQNNKKNGKTK